MIRVIYIFLFTFLSCVLELLLRNFGLFFPFCALFVFYAATAFGSSWGMFAAVLGAMALDFSGSGAAHPWSVLIFAAIVYFASFWLRKSESDSILMNFLPGLLIPPLVWILSLFFFSGHFFSVLTEQFPAVFPAAACSALWLPIMIFILDTLNARLSLPLFTDAKLKMKTKLEL
ncbi:MAG: hypothetical protein J5858_09725 [Lentisphaeria bacterium]|nr:hypothetical protein [Lentisphaeria bacterium]